MKKLFVVVVLVFLFSSLFIPYVVADSVPVTIFDAAFAAHHDYAALRDNTNESDHAYMSVGSVVAQGSGYLTVLTLDMAKVGLANATLEAVVYNSSMIEVATSVDTWNSSLFTTSLVAYSFQFNQTYLMSGGGFYWAGVRVQSGTLDDSNYVVISRGVQVDPDLYAYPMKYWTSAWNFDYHCMNNLLLMGETESAGGTPAPTVPATSDSGDATLAYWADIIMPWLVPMLLVLVPAFLGLKFLGQLGFYIGLNIGVVITYFMLPSYNLLWAVLLMGVLDMVIVFYRRS